MLGHLYVSSCMCTVCNDQRYIGNKAAVICWRFVRAGDVVVWLWCHLELFLVMGGLNTLFIATLSLDVCSLCSLHTMLPSIEQSTWSFQVNNSSWLQERMVLHLHREVCWNSTRSKQAQSIKGSTSHITAYLRPNMSFSIATFEKRSDI